MERGFPDVIRHLAETCGYLHIRHISGIWDSVLTGKGISTWTSGSGVNAVDLACGYLPFGSLAITCWQVLALEVEVELLYQALDFSNCLQLHMLAESCAQEVQRLPDSGGPLLSPG